MLSLISSYITGFILFYISLITIPSFTNPYYLPKLIVLQIGALLLLFVGLIKFLKTKRIFYSITRFHILLFLFACVNTIAFFISKSKTVSFFGLYGSEVQNYVFIINVLLVVFFYSFQKSSKIPTYFFIAGIYIHSFFVLYQYYFLHISRPNGLEGHPIWSAGIIAIGLLVALSNLKLKPIHRLPFILPPIISLIILDSSTVWVSLLIAFLGTLYFQKKERNYLIFFCSILVFLLFLYLIPKEQFSLQKRFEEYKTTVVLLKNKGLTLFGNGQNTSGLYALSYRTKEQNQDKEAFFRPTTIHNQFLETLFSTGIFGFIIWILLFCVALRKKENRTPFQFTLILFILVWQLFYYLPFSMYLISFIVLSAEKNLKQVRDDGRNIRYDKARYMCNRLISPDINLILMLFLFLIALIIGSLFFSYKAVRGEIAFSNRQFDIAVQNTPFNDQFLRESAYRTLQLTINCYKNLPTQNKKPQYYSDRILLLFNNYNYDEKRAFLYEQAKIGCTQTNTDELSTLTLKQLKKAVELNPLHPDNWNAYGSANFQIAHTTNYFELKDNYVQHALVSFLHAAAIEPNDPLYLDNLGLVYLDMKQFNKAKKYFTKALEIDPKNIVTLKHLQETINQQRESTK